MRLLVLLVALGCVIPWGTAEAENDQATGACFGKLREALEEIDTLQDELSDLKHIAAFSNDSLTLCKQELDNLEDFKRAAEQTDTQVDAYKKQLEEAKIVLEELQHELEKTVSAAEVGTLHQACGQPDSIPQLSSSPKLEEDQVPWISTAL